ncbi:MAG: glycosyltransferase [Lachnospiraceae bacterium]|nr:glycosyltransferase [Lachnospiraceae bacterium]
MKLLFIQGGSRWKRDTEGNLYTDANFTEEIWGRYRRYSEHLTVILRGEEMIYSVEEAQRRFNYFDSAISSAICLPDVYKPPTRNFNLKLRRRINLAIKEAVAASDAVIIRSVGNIYTNSALKWVRKLKKPYLVEVTGFAFESLWYHSFKGKIVALVNELQTKVLMKDVPYAVYVTNEALQKRYPCAGKAVGCSDVEVFAPQDSILEQRLQKINAKSKGDKIILGTAAFLDVGWKGQKYVIHALSELKKKGITNLEYQLIGAGNGKELIHEAQLYGVEQSVTIQGALPHEKVFEWMDHIDIYIQPSFMEGLCRSIVEAMSRACPVICSNVGGNYELVDKEYLFHKGDSKDLVCKIELLMKQKNMLVCASRNFNKSKEYEKNILDNKRNVFFENFFKEV